MRDSKEVRLLEKYGATNIKGYTLVNNYGYTFELNGKRWDARYWANCYGCALDEWRIDRCRDNDEPYPFSGVIKEIENELNKL